MSEFVGRIRTLALALGGPGLFLVAFLDSSFLPLPGITDVLLVVTVARHPGAAEIALYGMHAGGAFAVLSLASEGIEQCAAAARGPGLRVIAPRRLREAGPSWKEMGAGAAWDRLVAALGAEERR